MRVRWQKIVLWLIVEITLTILGLDDLADYSEFIFEQQAVLIRSDVSQLNLILPPTQDSINLFCARLSNLNITTTYFPNPLSRDTSLSTI